MAATAAKAWCELYAGVACLKACPDPNLVLKVLKTGMKLQDVGSQEKTKGSERELAAFLAYTLPQVFARLNYWFNGLKVRMVASAFEQAPAGSTRTTASSSAQNARIPVWLIESGIATTV